MRVASIVTSLTSLITALICAALALQAGLVTADHVQSGQPGMGALPLASTILGLYLTLVLGVPSIRDRLLSFGAKPAGRAMLGVPAVGILALIVLGGLRFATTEHAEMLMAAVPPPVLAALLAAFAVSYIATFVLPGLAYDKFRSGVAAAAAAATPQELRLQRLKAAQAMPEMTQQPAKRYLKLNDAEAEQGRGGRQRRAKAPARGAAVKLARTANFALLMSLVALWYYGSSWAKFLPAPEHVAHIAANKDMLIAGTCGALALLALLTPLPEGPGLFRFGLVRRLSFAVLSAFFGLMAPVALTTGLPAFHAQILPAPDAQLEVRILARGPQHQSRSCDMSATAAWPSARGYAQPLCSLPPEVWANLRPGDRVLLEGRQTRFGFAYTTGSIVGR